MLFSLLLGLYGCTYEPELVTISGQVADGRGDTVEPIPEVQVRTFDQFLTEVDSVQGDGRGWFEAEVVANSPMFIEVSAPGYATAGFAGSAPLVGTAVEFGKLWTTADAAMDVIDGAFGDCAQEGALIEGEVRLAVQGYSPEDGQDWPLAKTGWATAYDSEGRSYPACYLGEDGSYDPAALATGETGRFAIYGAPSGAVTLEVGYDVEEQTLSQEFYLYVPEEGVVSLYAVYLYL